MFWKKKSDITQEAVDALKIQAYDKMSEVINELPKSAKEKIEQIFNSIMKIDTDTTLTKRVYLQGIVYGACFFALSMGLITKEEMDRYEKMAERILDTENWHEKAE